MKFPLTKEYEEKKKIYEPYLVNGELYDAPPEAKKAYEENKEWFMSHFDD